MERRQSRTNRLGRIVRPPIEVLARALAERARPKRVADSVERRLTLATDQSARQSIDERLIGNVDLEDTVDLPFQQPHHLAERDRLFHRSRESVEEHARSRIRLLQPLVQHRDRDSSGTSAPFVCTPRLEARGASDSRGSRERGRPRRCASRPVPPRGRRPVSLCRIPGRLATRGPWCALRCDQSRVALRRLVNANRRREGGLAPRADRFAEAYGIRAWFSYGDRRSD
jgi:hypothetical protein